MRKRERESTRTVQVEKGRDWEQRERDRAEESREEDMMRHVRKENRAVVVVLVKG